MNLVAVPIFFDVRLCLPRVDRVSVFGQWVFSGFRYKSTTCMFGTGFALYYGGNEKNKKRIWTEKYPKKREESACAAKCL